MAPQSSPILRRLNLKVIHSYGNYIYINRAVCELTCIDKFCKLGKPPLMQIQYIVDTALKIGLKIHVSAIIKRIAVLCQIPPNRVNDY